MKIIFAASILFWTATANAARPDPRDSIILESKTVSPGQHPGDAKDTAAYFYIRVWITNKDSISNLTLPLVERSVSGGAYATIARPRNFNGTVNRLASTLPASSQAIFNRYNSFSPDSMILTSFFEPTDIPATAEPPNRVRKPFWEIKFDSVLPNPGKVELDSIKILSVTVQMVDLRGRNVNVNFVKSVITVAKPGKKGEPKTGGHLTPGNVVLALGRPFLEARPHVGGWVFDCDKGTTAPDFALLRNADFREEPFPR